MSPLQEHSQHTLSPKHRDLWLKVFPCLLASLAVLFYFPLAMLNLPGLALMVLALSWCLYQYFLPLHLIRRRALLEHMTSSHSVLRRWLWNGAWSRFLLLVWCVVLALGVLLLSSDFSILEWAILLCSIPVLLLLIPAALRWCGAESDQHYHLPLALRVAVYLTVVFCALALTAAQVFGEGVADTRQMSLLAVIAQSWADASASSDIQIIGILLAVEVVLNDTVWHLMQQASSLSEQSAALKLLAWLTFLMYVTLRAALLWFVLAGLSGWVLGVGKRRDRLLTGAKSGAHFVTGVSVLAIVSLIVSQPGVSAFVSRVADRSMQALPMPEPDPCARLAPIELARLDQLSRDTMVAASVLWQQDIGQQVDAALDAAFSNLEPAVDAYLDWNFSIPGQYQQLGFLAVTVVEKGLQQSSSESLDQAFAAYISSKIDEQISPQLSPLLMQASQDLQQRFDSAAQQFYLQQTVELEQLMASSPCLLPALSPLGMPELINKSAVGVGPVLGLLAGRLAVRGGAQVGAKVLTRNASKRAASASVAKVSGKMVQSASTGSLGLSCGVMAPVCAPVLFVATWFGTDFLINKFDESINRSQMREDMLAALQEEKQRISAHYKEVYGSGVSQLIAELSVHQDQRFRILRDGI
jgi:hypothetical protein